MKLTFVTVSAPAIDQMVPGALTLNIYYVASELSLKKSDAMEADVAGSDAVFLDLMGAPPTVVEAVNRGCERSRGNIIPYGASSREYLRLGQFSAASMKKSGDGKAPSMDMMKKMQSMAEAMGKVMPGKMRDMRNYSLLMKYFQNASQENTLNLLLLLLTEYGGIKGLPAYKPPVVPLPAALYSLPDMTAYQSAKEYASAQGFSQNRPSVLLLFSAYAYPTDTTGCVTALRNELNKNNNVYAVGTSASFAEVEQNLRAYIADIPGGVDLTLNCCPFRLAAGPMGGEFMKGVRFLQEMDVPYLHPFFLTRRTQSAWAKSTAGCTPTETMLSVMLPELDGAIDTIPVGAMSEPRPDERYDTQVFDLVPIRERMERVAARAQRHIALRKKKNSDKRVAIICYNYPPGEANLFGGAFLDTFASVSAILDGLQSEGYGVDPMSADALRSVFTAGRAVNSGKYETDWPDAIRYDPALYRAPDEITTSFGKKPGDIMAEDGRFFIPGVVDRNVFVGLQPARGAGEAAEASYHDKQLPPHHQYAAFYQWLREEFRADVIVHVGTHGTLEFLKGKESGMSGACYPDMLIGDLPHIYLYYCGNPSEAVIAKRRCHANLVSYQPPVFVESELYGDYLELETLIESHRQALLISPESAADAERLALEQAALLELPDDLEQVETELYRMRHSLIPNGLHVFGEAYTPHETETYHHTLEKRAVEDGADTAQAARQAEQSANAAKNNNEMKGLMAALRAGFNTPRLGGDIFRNPEVLPAGYNIYQFDPRLVPSETAMERGKRIAENTLEAYLNEYGDYPKSTAVILWGLETSRTQGETLGQVLAYLGVRFAKNTHVWNQRFDIVPLKELGRPRIDVTINICGFFRDMFPMLIENLDDLFLRIFDLDEPDDRNFFRANAKRRYTRLLDEGYEPQEAKQLAAARFFGPPEGEYGTGLTDIIGGKNWEEEDRLGLSFTASLRHVYSRRLHGRTVKGLYEDNLSCVDVVSQLRSNNEYEITDLDHYYEFFGGLAKSVELARGKKAAMYITDTTGHTPSTETVDRSIARGIRTRVLNPKWIDGLLAHPYHGAQKIADRFENVMGLAATTNAVDPWIYDELHAKYVGDEALKKRMAENNPHAYMRMLEQMMEYHARGYWNATDEQLQSIREAYLEIENELEGTI
jgi:cobaltochelatase CobN